MDPVAVRALQRLRSADSEAIRKLARMTVVLTTRTPLTDIASPRWVAGQLATALEAATHDDLVRNWALQRIDAERTRAAKEQRPLRTWLPPEADEPLRNVLGRPYTPDAELLLKLMDQPAMNGMMREVLGDTVRKFRDRLQSLDGGRLKDLSQRAARRSKGLLGGVGNGWKGNLRAGFGGLGGAAENLVGTVKNEVEASLEARIDEFLAGATGEAIRAMAQRIADPSHADEFAQMRLDALDVLLDRPVSDLADEADRLRPEEILDVVVIAIRSAVADPGFVDRAEEAIARAMAEAGDGTLGAWLDEVGLTEVWTDTTTELVAARLQAVVATADFEQWWQDLFSDEA